MTKAEIVNEISSRTNVNRAEVLKTVEAFMDTVKASLVNGENVYLRGFGTYQIKHRAEKVARNISKNSAVVIPEHKIPAFKPGREFTEEVKKAHQK